ncbi:MAG: helix-turn-helix domain-containing protein [Opitutaceae bacterium]|nr:helix-turn-helix domain-containing protein [Opitutaceae bacterium]
MARVFKASDKATTPLHFGGWLRHLREERHLPLRAVAAAVEMDQAHLSKVELGQRIPTAEQTTALAKFFHQNPTHAEARRIAEKFRQEHADNPAAAQALQILNEEAAPYAADKKE